MNFSPSVTQRLSETIHKLSEENKTLREENKNLKAKLKKEGKGKNTCYFRLK
jgi:regulator of replication initiation timing